MEFFSNLPMKLNDFFQSQEIKESDCCRSIYLSFHLKNNDLSYLFQKKITVKCKKLIKLYQINFAVTMARQVRSDYGGP